MQDRKRLPPWLKVPFPSGAAYMQMKGLLRGAGLHTVCEEARCPNIGECFACGTATFLILGSACTRNCGFCAVETGRPVGVDLDEPNRVADAVLALSLKHVVVTSVTRDDLPDGGASIFAATISRIRSLSPDCRVEVLVPDFRGSPQSLRKVIEAAPHILGHNVETVPGLYPRVRPQASYQTSLSLLASAKEIDGTPLAKSGIMVGLGESKEELRQVFEDLRKAGCDIVTVGQYLRPSLAHLPVERYYTPEEFGELKSLAEGLGFKHVESGPLVRSSYHAERAV
ncbi:MAG: lipoyl synthase [Chloroflexi bacterium]|nr:lipoyl synthase [Chloroflexota bacterium]